MKTPHRKQAREESRNYLNLISSLNGGFDMVSKSNFIADYKKKYGDDNFIKGYERRYKEELEERR